MTAIPDVLAGRYASDAMTDLWSPASKIVLERRLWLAVLEAQRSLGVPVPEGTIEAYEAVVDRVDLDSIDARERITRHDVKARIEEFCALAGSEHIHKGMTSRDLTENVEQLQIRRSLQLVASKSVSVLARLAERATEHAGVVMAGRTHNVPAQAITLGRRFANAGQELLFAVRDVEAFLDAYPLRGVKGPVGTQQDLLDLFDGDAARVDELESIVADRLGFGSVIGSVGQTYPRSLDFAVVARLLAIAGGPGSLATTIRLMAGAELVSEGFGDGQVGSSAMPHKMNSRSSERITGFVTILRGHAAMAAGLVGDQWNEGDVSDSVVRRVVLPDSFFAIDGLLETTLTVLDDFVVFEPVVERELQRYLPFLSTTSLLIEAVRAGLGREEAHARIKDHAVASALAMRDGSTVASDLFDRVSADPGLPVDVASITARPEALVGRSGEQIATFVAAVAALIEEHPGAGDYRPEPIL